MPVIGDTTIDTKSIVRTFVCREFYMGAPQLNPMVSPAMSLTITWRDKAWNSDINTANRIITVKYNITNYITCLKSPIYNTTSFAGESFILWLSCIYMGLFRECSSVIFPHENLTLYAMQYCMASERGNSKYFPSWTYYKTPFLLTYMCKQSLPSDLQQTKASSTFSHLGQIHGKCSLTRMNQSYLLLPFYGNYTGQAALASTPS